MAQHPPIAANGIALDLSEQAFGAFKSSIDLVDDAAALRDRIAHDGYLYLPGLLDPEIVLAARREILLKYATVGEIDNIRHDVMDAIRSDHTAIDKVNLRAFTESVRTGLAYERVILDQTLMAFLETLLGGEVRPFDFRWPRFVRPGEACGFHADGPYMNRGTDKIFTTWIPLGAVKPYEGGLILLENSHNDARLLETYAKRDADKDKIQWLSTDPVKLQRRIGGRWLTTDFEAGDVLCFGMHTLHGALDNNSEIGRCRLSSDTRYQRADEPLDERWNGAHPEAHGYDKVFLPGLGQWNNRDFQDEWKRVDDNGRLVISGERES